MKDDEIIAAIRAGDREAGNRLANRYYRELNIYYRKRLPNDEAEELTQATLAETIARIDRFRGESSFRHYVFSVATRILAERQRRLSRRIRTEPEPSSEPADPKTPAFEQHARNELLEHLSEEVAKLEEHYQSVLDLKLRGATNHEIADALGLQYNTVRSRLSRAIAAVRKRLGDRLTEFFAVPPPKSTKEKSS